MSLESSFYNLCEVVSSQAVGELPRCVLSLV